MQLDALPTRNGLSRTSPTTDASNTIKEEIDAAQNCGLDIQEQKPTSVEYSFEFDLDECEKGTSKCVVHDADWQGILEKINKTDERVDLSHVFVTSVRICGHTFEDLNYGIQIFDTHNKRLYEPHGSKKNGSDVWRDIGYPLYKKSDVVLDTNAGDDRDAILYGGIRMQDFTHGVQDFVPVQGQEVKVINKDSKAASLINWCLKQNGHAEDIMVSPQYQFGPEDSNLIQLDRQTFNQIKDAYVAKIDSLDMFYDLSQVKVKLISLNNNWKNKEQDRTVRLMLEFKGHFDL